MSEPWFTVNPVTGSVEEVLPVADVRDARDRAEAVPRQLDVMREAAARLRVIARQLHPAHNDRTPLERDLRMGLAWIADGCPPDDTLEPR